MNEAALDQARKQLELLGAALPQKGRVLIVPHDYPDPDALGSAAAMELLLHERFKLHAQIVFSGEVSRAENKELLRQCHYRWHLLQDVRPTRKRIPCVFVDTAPWSGNVTVPSFGKPVAVIDHHPFKSKRRWADVFADVRVGAGATASIMHEYLQAAGVPVPKWLASILAYAITAETLDLYRASTDLDLEAYMSLLARSNMTSIGKMRHAPLPRAYYGQLQEALRNALVYGRTSWSHLDTLVQPEIVAEIAELLLLMERITWSVCTAYHGDRLLISVRSGQKSARCGSLLKTLVRKQGSVGGHDQAGAGYLDVAGLDPAAREQRREAFLRALLAKIEHRPLPDEPLGLLARPLIEPVVK